jgi:hypothetical protein
MDTNARPAPWDAMTTFYAEVLRYLKEAGVPFLIGGAFATSRYTGIDRLTKDLDVFLHPADVPDALDALQHGGYHAWLPYPHWLGKVERGDICCLDMIFSSGNGIARVDESWFDHAVEDDVLGMRLLLCPPEETLWSKAFVQERERFDGADVLHLIRALGPALDWDRLLGRFGELWPVLLSHLVLFRFAYPDCRDHVPQDVMEELTTRLLQQRTEADNPVCLGTLLSREQYLPDLTMRGYEDARVRPYGTLTHQEVETWTQAIGRERGRAR